jgi:hypothetical protein
MQCYNFKLNKNSVVPGLFHQKSQLCATFWDDDLVH